MKLQTGQKKIEFPPIGYEFKHLKNYKVSAYDMSKIKFCIVAEDENGNVQNFQPAMFQTPPYDTWKKS